MYHVRSLLRMVIMHAPTTCSFVPLSPQLSWTDVTDALCDCVAASTIAASAKKSACKRFFVCLASAAEFELTCHRYQGWLPCRNACLAVAAPGVGANTVAAVRNSALAEIRDLLDRASRHSEQGLGAGTQC